MSESLLRLLRSPAGSRVRRVGTAALVALMAACEPQAGDGLDIRVLSGRADMVSGGDSLVELAGVGEAFIVEVDGREVTQTFQRRSDGRVIGRLTGLTLGGNVVRLVAEGRERRLTLVNHPVGGPVFSGEQLQPWLCTTERNGLGPPIDDQCHAQTVVHYFYWPADGSGFRAYDPANPPADVAQTTTDQGRSVPFIVRQETGTQNRGIYRVAVLFDPSQGWQPWARQQGWNGKLHYPFGASCGTVHGQGDAQPVLIHRALSRGFMVATSSLNVLGASCNATTSAEAVMMLKEHIVETYGEIRYTLAEGGSGGAIGQHLVANNYPGLLQGIQPAVGYEDVWSTSMEVADCYLLLSYYEAAPAGLWADEQDRIAVTGHATLGACEAWRPWFAQFFSPRGSCGLDAASQYHPVDNPRGCRSTVQDFNVATLGRRAPELWSQSATEETRTAEAIAGGFAVLPYDNTGVQYGWQALLDGRIDAEQFVHLNENLGAFEIDAQPVPGRRRADAGAGSLYRTGAINDGAQLDQVAIIDLRASSNFEIHTDYHSYAMRARLDRANGHHDNQVIWTHTIAEYSEGAVADQAFMLLDRWLAAVEADASEDPIEVKLTRNKPADAVDTCFLDGMPETDASRCAEAYPHYAAPRVVAGMPMSHDIASCQLKPLDRREYLDIEFSEAQWSRLQAVFPSGVCDYGKPAVDSEPSVPWLSYAAGAGGQPLPEAR